MTSSKPKKTPANTKAVPPPLEIIKAQVAKMLESDNFDPKLSRLYQWMVNQDVRNAAELEKRQDRAERRVRELKWAHVVAWLRRLADAEWSRLVREVEAARGGRGSVLG